ncbi:hypothetical protein J7L65_02165 [Candidatus Bathyarchaeota archaeon]|nr:hypothetical protein [Candidatus Bathyarchaeota archaeon]
MVETEIKRIAVLGAGVMGHGIAQVAALSGFEVWVRDIAQEILDKARERIEGSLRRSVERGRLTEDAMREALSRIHMTLDLKEAVGDADLVIEAVPENLDLKRRVWSETSQLARGDTILATNTSSLSINELAEAVSRPERFLGMHFFNPPTRMKLVEVIPGERTEQGVVEAVMETAERMGKTPILVRKDRPGFIVNRILITYLNEAAKLLERGEYGKEQIDSAMQYKAKMPLGPFMLIDLIGVDVVYHILKVFEEKLGPEYAPAKPIVELYEAGKLGRKTGEGFYNYAERPTIPEEAGEAFDPEILWRVIRGEAEKVVEEGIAPKEDVDKAMKLGANLPKGPFEV